MHVLHDQRPQHRHPSLDGGSHRPRYAHPSPAAGALAIDEPDRHRVLPGKQAAADFVTALPVPPLTVDECQRGASIRTETNCELSRTGVDRLLHDTPGVVPPPTQEGKRILGGSALHVCTCDKDDDGRHAPDPASFDSARKSRGVAQCRAIEAADRWDDRGMPRILFAAQPTVAGVAQCVLDWTTGLRDRGWDVNLACPDDGWLSQRCADAGISVDRWDSVRQPYKGVRRELSQLRAIVDRHQPDVVFLQGSKAGLIGRMLLRGNAPVAFSPHSWSFEAADGPIGWAALQWERGAARWTDRFICVSEAEAEDGRSHGIHGDYVIARNGIDTQQIHPLTTEQRQALREHLSMAPHEITVVCVGRVHRQKGQDVLLQAWPHVDAPDARLFIVGDGPELPQARALATNSVTLVGGVDRAEALEWMQAADLLVMPSRWEGMALVPLESLAVGTPVIASDVTGAREAVDETCGELFEPENPPALAATLTRWIPRVAEEGEALRDAARRRILAGFDLSGTVAVLDETLRGMLRTQP